MDTSVESTLKNNMHGAMRLQKGPAWFSDTKDACLQEKMFEPRYEDLQFTRWRGKEDCARLMEEFTQWGVGCCCTQRMERTPGGPNRGGGTQPYEQKL